MEGGSPGGRALGVPQASALGFHGDYVPGTGTQTHWLGWAATRWGGQGDPPPSWARGASKTGATPACGEPLHRDPQHLCLWPHPAPKEVGVGAH